LCLILFISDKKVTHDPSQVVEPTQPKSMFVSMMTSLKKPVMKYNLMKQIIHAATKSDQSYIG